MGKQSRTRNLGEAEYSPSRQSSSAEDESDTIVNTEVTFDDDVSYPATTQPTSNELSFEGIEESIRRLDQDALNESDFDLDAPHLDADDASLYDGNLLLADVYREGMKTIRDEDFMRKEYAPSTLKQVYNVQNQWREFCHKILHTKRWKDRMKNLEFRTVHAFLFWVLNHRVGSKGRAKSGMKSKSSMITFWCVFRLVYERQMLAKINTVIDTTRVSNALRKLTRGLKTEKRENRSMSLEDLKLQIETTLCTTEKSFKLGELRVLAVLFLLLVCPTGSRPGAILGLQFGDIQVSLMRDPNGGPHRLVIACTLNKTKTYKGKKEPITFLLPEVIFDPSLYLSPHVFMLAILLQNRAFQVEHLNDDIRALDKLEIHPKSNELRLTIKKELRKVPIFRQVEKTMDGYQMSLTKSITTVQMGQWVKRLGELTGFESNTICYCLRYMAGNKMDQNVNISDALRNLMLGHAPLSDTFQKHYLSRFICVDLMAVHRDLEPQQALVSKATSHGHSRDARRPADLDEEGKQALKSHPKLVRLRREMEEFPERTEERREAYRKLQSAENKLYLEAKQKFRSEWADKQAAIDIEAQVQGQAFVQPASSTNNDAQLMRPEQQRIVEALTAPLVNDLEAQHVRRANAVVALLQYCKVEELHTTKVMPAVPVPPELEQPGGIDTEALKRSVLLSKTGEDYHRCFICIGKAIRLSQDNGPLPDDDLSPDNVLLARYCRNYANARNVRKHFEVEHLNPIGDHQASHCPICDVDLRNKAHLQSHAAVVHGINTAKRETFRNSNLGRQFEQDGLI